MNSGYQVALISGISLIVILIFLFVPKMVQNKADKKAKNSPPVRAKVLKVEGNSVIFELQGGNRVTILVPNNTYVEGDVGMLRYHQERTLSPTGYVDIATFGSFEVVRS